MKLILEHSTDTQEQPISLIVPIFFKNVPKSCSRRSPGGAQNRLKVVPREKKVIQGVLFCRFLCIMLFFLIFHSILDGFSYQISWVKTVVFFTLACFFPTWRPSRNIVFYRSGATFSFFKFLHFWKNMDEK